jgi:NAD(P)H-dependent flavin oxidoreductase YrpB (nitropropane dioxygenase family)
MSDKPYFAPPSKGAAPEGEVPSWGQDAQEIAREAGLGSYGGTAADQEMREESMLRALEDAEREAGLGRPMRGLVVVLCAAVLVLGAVVAWMLFSR